MTTSTLYRLLHWPVLVALLGAAMIWGLISGRYDIGTAEVVMILRDWALGRPPEGITAMVVTNVRLPRILLAGLVGAGLALCGVALQTLFRNPLVSPKVLGLSSGSALGGVIAILFGASGLWLMGAVFASAFAALFAVVAIGHLAGRTMLSIVLAGIVIDALFSAGISLAQYVADPETSLPAIVFWLMGSFSTASWDKFGQSWPFLLGGLVLLSRMRFRITALAMGDDEARAFGINIASSRMMIFVLVSVLVGASVAVAGVIGWVGLVIPHIARLLVGEDQRRLYPTTILLGASFMVGTDTLARSLTSAEIPLGILTAIIGAPIFVWLLCTRKRRLA